jgi:hypothetical protein
MAAQTASGTGEAVDAFREPVVAHRRIAYVHGG